MDYIPTLPPSKAWQKPIAGSPFSQEVVPAVPMPSAATVLSGEDLLGGIESQSLPEQCSRLHKDIYGWRAHAALDAIREIPGPDGLIVWLRDRAPFLYRKLTCDLPDKISRAWEARGPYDSFDALCFDLVDTYRRAAELMLVSR